VRILASRSQTWRNSSSHAKRGGSNEEGGSTELAALGRIDDLERNNLRLRSLIAKAGDETRTKPSNCLCVCSQCAKYQRTRPRGRGNINGAPRGRALQCIGYEVASIK